MYLMDMKRMNFMGVIGDAPMYVMPNLHSEHGAIVRKSTSHRRQLQILCLGKVGPARKILARKSALTPVSRDPEPHQD
jgi:hypothetical protein